MSLLKLGFKKTDNRPSQKRRLFDIGAATTAGALTSVLPGVPLGGGVIAGTAPKGHKTELAAKATAGSIIASVPVGMYGLHSLAKERSATGKADYAQLGRRARDLGGQLGQKGKRLSTLKHIWKQSKGVTKRMYLANIVVGGLATGAAYAHASKPYYKNASFVKLGFHPESFTQPSFEKDKRFIESYKRPGITGKARNALNSPLTWALGGVSLFMTHKKRSDNPESVWPYLTGSLLAAVAIKRWINASKREKQRFVREYNDTMGTTFTVEHPKMQSLWNLTHAKANKINRMREM